MNWYYGWTVIAVAIAFQAMIVGIVFYGFTMWVTPWMTEFGVGRGPLMIANAGATLATGALMLIAGWIMDRYPMRLLVIGGTLALALGLVLVSRATSVWQIIVLYTTLISLGFAFAATLAGQVLAARWFPDRVGLAVGIVLLGSSFGGMIMPPVIGWLMTHVGWRDTNLILAALVVAVVVPLVWFVVRLPFEGEAQTSAQRRAKPTDPPAAPVQAVQHPLWSFGDIIREPTFWIVGIACLGTSLASYAFMQNVGPYAHELGIGAESMSLLIPVLAVTGIAGKLVLGAMADRWDPRVPYWVATGVIWAPLLLTLDDPSYWTLMVISGMVGLGAGGLLPVCSAIVGQKFGPRSFSRVMGMATPFFSVAAAAGPVISGFVRDHSSSYATAFGLYLVVLPAAALLMALLNRRPIAPSSGGGPLPEKLAA
ncbi:MAG: MFS transporter [Alphaproteobacteria bacterium]|nr:MFS transporter [Alphaproteobacteria bacterium]